jgi:hypothetical protein
MSVASVTRRIANMDVHLRRTCCDKGKILSRKRREGGSERVYEKKVAPERERSPLQAESGRPNCTQQYVGNPEGREDQ